jgi:hypothetical protein
MGLLLLGWAVIQHPVIALVPLLLVTWSLAVVETSNEEYGDFVK